MSEELDAAGAGGEGLSTIMKVVCFLIPLVGLILYFVKKKEEPTKSSEAGKMALYGFIFGIVLNVVMSMMG